MNVILLKRKKFIRRIEQKKERKEVKNKKMPTKKLFEDIFCPENFLTVFKKLKSEEKKNNKKTKKLQSRNKKK